MSYQTAISGLDWSMVSSGITIPSAGIFAMQTYEQSMGAIIAGNNVGVIMANVSSANYTGTINDIVYDVIVISGTISTNRTVNLYFDGSLNGNKRYTVLNDVVAVSGGLYTVTLTTGLGTSVVLTAPASPSPTSMILIYVDTLGNVVAGGDIVSSGSNSNGYYIQFADGTMICRQNTATITIIGGPYDGWYEQTLDWTFPVPFVGSPQVPAPGFMRTVAGLATFTWIGLISSSGTRFVANSLDNSTQGYFLATATGRWK